MSEIISWINHLSSPLDSLVYLILVSLIGSLFAIPIQKNWHKKNKKVNKLFVVLMIVPTIIYFLVFFHYLRETWVGIFDIFIENDKKAESVAWIVFFSIYAFIEIFGRIFIRD